MMTGMGEDVYTPAVPSEADAMVETAARWLLLKRHGYEMRPGMSSLVEARAVLESLGIPLEVLAALKAGTWRAVPKEPTDGMIISARRELNTSLWGPVASHISAAIAAAPTTPTEES